MIPKRTKILKISPERQRVFRYDGGVDITTYAGLLIENGQVEEILPGDGCTDLAIGFLKKQVLFIQFEEEDFEGDLFLVWMEKGSVDMQFLLAHTTKDGIRSIKCRADIFEPVEIVNCTRKLLELGKECIQLELPFDLAKKVLQPTDADKCQTALPDKAGLKNEN